MELGSTRIAIEDSSQTAEARRIARKMALDIGLDASDAERVAIAVTEACTNLLKHATRGEVLLSVTPDAPLELEILALDKGPGIANLEKCLQDGYSTGGSAGQGLGAITRLSDVSDFYSVAGRGTAVLARWVSPPLPLDRQRSRNEPRIGVVNACKHGQDVCGDSWGVEHAGEIITVLVADGLGHGPEAKIASREAVRMLHMNPEISPLALIERCHTALRSTRGAAVSVARINRREKKVYFCGVGNVSAQVYSGATLSQQLVSVHGTAGHQMHRLHEFNYIWPDDGMLIMHSDGLSTATNAESRAGLALRDPALIAGVLYRDFSRGNDDATIVVTK